MNNALHYIIHFLLGENVSEETVNTIGYTSDQNLYPQYNLVIIPSGFFDDSMYRSPLSIPNPPLPEIEGIPLLFGHNKVEWIGSTQVVYADIIASTYFLITRYEEIMKRNVRDEYGRFPGKESLPYRAGFLHRPIVDEYRKLLHHWLKESQIQIPDIKTGIQKVYLTHDVDAPSLYRTWKGMIRSLRDHRGIYQSLKGKLGSIEKDPYYTFPWLFIQNNALKKRLGKEHCQTILFMKGGGDTREDKPVYSLRSPDIQKLIKDALSHNIEIGLHSSYRSGINPRTIPKEKKNLEKYIGKTVRFNRHHFLASREPEDLDKLEAAGFTDDFTMGYADVAGFRLGTCYPVCWINPLTRRLSSLRLHPLIIMDCSLDQSKYMGFTYEEAETYCVNLINQISRVGGNLVMLWHNNSFSRDEENYHRKLYLHLSNELTKQTFQNDSRKTYTDI